MASRVVESGAWICGIGASCGSGFQFSVFSFRFQAAPVAPIGGADNTPRVADGEERDGEVIRDP
jgi:hypothetical protein